MALYSKQDFSPPILSKKWVAMKIRPNMLLYRVDQIIAILESGLLFREDSIEVEVACEGEMDRKEWFTTGEQIMSFAALTAAVLLSPPSASLTRGSCIKLSLLASLPLCVRIGHRACCRGRMRGLLRAMSQYCALARRAAACLADCNAIAHHIESLTAIMASTRSLLSRQQSALGSQLQRCGAALLGNVPWLRGAACEDMVPVDSLVKIHHAYLVVQSTFLRHLAMAHITPPLHILKMYKNYNERLYWIHTVLIQDLEEEFNENYESLQRMYRLLKNYGNKDATPKKLGFALHNNWLYSDVHNGIARACLELKIAQNKCSAIDVLLDACATNKHTLDLAVLDKDLDALIDDISKCLSTTQNSQIKLKKLQNKFGVREKKVVPENDEVENEDSSIVKIEDKYPEPKDEVFYLLKTEDDVEVQPPADTLTGPGKKEKDATKVVLNELKRKLVRRENAMRVRERQALVNSMPELKNIPEFPRQIQIEEPKKGFINKLKRKSKEKLFKDYRIKSKRREIKKYTITNSTYTKESEIPSPFYEANAILNTKSKLITFSKNNNINVVTRWRNKTQSEKDLEFSSLSEDFDESQATNRTVNQAVNVDRQIVNEAINFDRQNVNEAVNFDRQNVNEAVNFDRQNGANAHNGYRFSKKDLELSSSSSESDFEFYKKQQVALLKDIRRNRAVRKKNFPAKTASVDKEDESLKPIEYSFGTGMAMASVLQVNNKRFPNMGQEEIFTGAGEVSEDSGNDEDA